MFAYQYLRRYNEATDLYFALRQSSATNALPPSLTTAPVMAAGDCVISKDGAAPANTTNLPTSIGNGLWKLVLTAAETQGTNIDIMVNDVTAPQVWIGCHLHIETRVRLRSVNVSNDAGDGVTFESTGSNGKGLVVTGQGSGHAALFTAGATGDGIQTLGGATSGAGIATKAVGGGNGIAALGIGAGDGIDAQGGTTGRGIDATGGATSGEGIRATAQAGNDEGIMATGQGTGPGIYAQGGLTADGLKAASGATSGSGASFSGGTAGMLCTSAGANPGIYAQNTGTGEGMKIASVGANAPGLTVQAGGASSVGMYISSAADIGLSVQGDTEGVLFRGGATGGAGLRLLGGPDSEGLEVVGIGTGNGITVTPGATGNGVYIASGVTSGSGMKIQSMSNGAYALDLVAISGRALSAEAATGTGAYFTGLAGSATLGGTLAGMYVEGTGAFHALYAKALLTGDAVRVESAFNGIGLNCIAGGGNAAGAKFTGSGTGAGFEIVGGATGDAMMLTGGDAKAGLRCTAAGNGYGMAFVGAGSGAGASFTGGVTGNGFEVNGGITSGHGAYFKAATLGHGMYAEGAGALGCGYKGKAGTTGQGMLLQGGTVSGNGFRAEGLAGNASGFYGLGQGTGHGIEGSPDIFPLAAAFWDENMGAEPVAALADNPTFRSFFHWLGVYMFNRATQNATTRTFYKNDSATAIGTQAVTFDGTTQEQGKLA